MGQWNQRCIDVTSVVSAVKAWQRFILSFPLIFSPLYVTFSVSLFRGLSPFCIAAADECETSAELLQPVSARRSIVSHAARQTVDTEQRRHNDTSACLDNKKAKKSFQAMTKRERRKMGTELCLEDGLKMPWGQRERRFMTIQWLPMSRFQVTGVVCSDFKLSS